MPLFIYTTSNFKITRIKIMKELKKFPFIKHYHGATMKYLDNILRNLKLYIFDGYDYIPIKYLGPAIYGFVPCKLLFMFKINGQNYCEDINNLANGIIYNYKIFYIVKHS